MAAEFHADRRLGPPQAEPAAEDLPRLRAAVRVAQEVGEGLGRGALLLRRLPRTARPRAAAGALTNFSRARRAPWAAAPLAIRFPT